MSLPALCRGSQGGSQGSSPELRKPAQRGWGGGPGEPVCARWAWAAGEGPCSISTRIWGRVCVYCRMSQNSYYG